MTRFGRGQRGICGEHLYSHFFSEGHSGLTDVSVQIIDKTEIGDPTTREVFWTHKLLKYFTPLGLNIMIFNFCKDIVYIAAIYGQEI